MGNIKTATGFAATQLAQFIAPSPSLSPPCGGSGADSIGGFKVGLAADAVSGYSPALSAVNFFSDAGKLRRT